MFHVPEDQTVMEELIPIVMFLSIAAVAILRPITTKLGSLLEAMAREKKAGLKAGEDTDSARVRVLVEHMSRRLDLIEERLDFTERLISTARPAATASPALRPETFRRDRETDRLTG